ncbi:hypothetical protein Y025_5265 [Burkholderia pseudomallei TSV32]|nr:hypothetical protein Y042_5905 [Burkholderia pseudomallei MSHR1357]KGX51076.1 hypothetical protein Y025_5265 [Burkholderia pseudomallei TSV32]
MRGPCGPAKGRTASAAPRGFFGRTGYGAAHHVLK